MKSEVRELLTEELKDAYSAEKQALRCMQKALRKASAEALREGIQLHIEQTQVQIERVEQAMEKMSVRPGRKVCEAMRGLVEEAQHEIEEHDEKGPILDLVIVAGMQRIEHYEIAAYGTDVALAKALGEKEVADLLSQTLEEEKQTDLKLTEVTQKAIMPAGARRRGGRRRHAAAVPAVAAKRPSSFSSFQARRARRGLRALSHEGYPARRAAPPLPSSRVTAGTAAVKASAPRAASRACWRTRRASCSVCPGEDRAASTPKIAAMTRLTPRRMAWREWTSKRAAGPATPAPPPAPGRRGQKSGRQRQRPRAAPAAPSSRAGAAVRLERDLEKINASHGAAPIDQRRSPAGKRKTG